MSEKTRNQRRVRLLSVIEPKLMLGERVEVISFAQVAFKRGIRNEAALAMATKVAVAAAVSAATSATVVPIFTGGVKDHYYVVLTSHRLLIIANYRSRRTTGFGAIEMAVPRELVAARLVTDRILAKVRLDIQGSDTTLRLTYALRAQYKAEARSLVGALGG